MTQEAVKLPVEAAKPLETAEKPNRVQEFMASLNEDEAKYFHKTFIRPSYNKDFEEFNAKSQKKIAEERKARERAEQTLKESTDEETVGKVSRYNDELVKAKERAVKRGVPEYAVKYIRDFDSLGQAEDDFATRGQNGKGAEGAPDNEAAQFAQFQEWRKASQPGKGTATERWVPGAGGAPAGFKSVAELQAIDTRRFRDAKQMREYDRDMEEAIAREGGGVRR